MDGGDWLAFGVLVAVVLAMAYYLYKHPRMKQELEKSLGLSGATPTARAAPAAVPPPVAAPAAAAPLPAQAAPLPAHAAPPPAHAAPPPAPAAPAAAHAAPPPAHAAPPPAHAAPPPAHAAPTPAHAVPPPAHAVPPPAHAAPKPAPKPAPKVKKTPVLCKFPASIPTERRIVYGSYCGIEGWEHYPPGPSVGSTGNVSPGECTRLCSGGSTSSSECTGVLYNPTGGGTCIFQKPESWDKVLSSGNAPSSGWTTLYRVGPR